MSLDNFREEVREWLAENCPEGARGPGQILTGSSKVEIENPDNKLWLDRMAEKGWTAPTWPVEYGGGGLDADEAKILKQELKALKLPPPLVGFGLTMIGPTLLRFGTDDQKALLVFR